ncbi:uncharacterized protein LOC119363943 isoform X1 [Triticum dicoccoides]|uniref:uncharacterized protein LOC119363943 isoform X1 n=1 Tax=Triticum dicoccoides TaxID=85692 RepID=UPI00188FFBD2|nr:uncharacterized protein LOC119363943 isoform X1 [Triticum dicoccoides]XP_044324035.1 uncharacterized protein LOC123045159 isoform X1 [Triticum aestivum]
MASALGASPWPPTHPPTTIGAHRRWIRAGEEQLQLWWGASVPKMKEDFTTAMEKRRLKLGKTTMSGANRDPKCREAGFIFSHHHNKGETPGRERKAAQVPLEARQLGAVAEEELRFHGVERRGAPASL